LYTDGGSDEVRLIQRDLFKKIIMAFGDKVIGDNTDRCKVFAMSIT
jgi:hypothetical protein